MEIEYIKVDGLLSKLEIQINFCNNEALIIGENAKGKTYLSNLINHCLAYDYGSMFMDYIYKAVKIKYKNKNKEITINKSEFIFSEKQIKELIDCWKWFYASMSLPLYGKKDYEFQRGMKQSEYNILVKEFWKNFKNKKDFIFNGLKRFNYLYTQELYHFDYYNNILYQAYEDLKYFINFYKNNYEITFPKSLELLEKIKRIRTNYDEWVKLNQKNYKEFENSVKKDGYCPLHINNADKDDNNYNYHKTFIKQINKVWESLNQKLFPLYYVLDYNRIKSHRTTAKPILDTENIKAELIEYVSNKSIFFKDKLEIIKSIFNSEEYDKSVEHTLLEFSQFNTVQILKEEKWLKTIMTQFNKLFPRIDLILNETGFSIAQKENPWKGQPVSKLSSGENSLFFILTKLIEHKDKKIHLIIDEPEASLSVVSQEKLYDFLKTQTNIKTKIFITHSPLFAKLVHPESINFI